MNKVNKQHKRHLRHNRVRSVVKGTADRPRISVFRSNQHLYVQLIDDSAGKTLAEISDRTSDKKGKSIGSATQVGKSLAEKAKTLSIKQAVFDRGGYKYHGRIKAIAEGAREGGLEF